MTNDDRFLADHMLMMLDHKAPDASTSSSDSGDGAADIQERHAGLSSEQLRTPDMSGIFEKRLTDICGSIADVETRCSMSEARADAAELQALDYEDRRDLIPLSTRAQFAYTTIAQQPQHTTACLLRHKGLFQPDAQYPVGHLVHGACHDVHLAIMSCSTLHQPCRLHEAEAILDEAIPELTDLRTRNAQLNTQVRPLPPRTDAVARRIHTRPPQIRLPASEHLEGLYFSCSIA